MRIATLLVALSLTASIARAQSIAIPKSTYEFANGMATVNTLANGERWVIIHGQDMGVQLQPGMPVAGQFATNVVFNDDDGSIQLSIVGDCQARTFELTGSQAYQGPYRTGDPVGPKHGLAVLKHVDDDSPVAWVFATVCVAP